MKNNKKNNYLIFGCIILLVFNFFIGCETKKNNDNLQNSKNEAIVKFQIAWPYENTNKAIPVNTNRLIFYINGPDMLGSVSYILDKNNSDQVSTVNLKIPAGYKRMFTVEARHVHNTKYFKPQKIKTANYIESRELKEGTILGVGKNNQAFNVLINSKINVDIEIEAVNNKPIDNITNVDITLNQVIVDRFPAVQTIQIVRDQSGNPIDNLNSANFEIIEDGKEAIITDVRTVLSAKNNINVALVLDRSGSMMGSANNNLEIATTNFINLLQNEDRAEVINFNSNVTVSQSFTSDKNLLLAAIKGKYVGGSTNLYDAIYRAIADISNVNGRKAIIAMTDGKSGTFRHKKNDVINFAKEKGVPIFTIGLGKSNDIVLSEIASKTGGLFIKTFDSNELDDIYKKISNQLDSQMQITFISPNPQSTNINRSINSNAQSQNIERNLILKWHYGNLSGEIPYKYNY